MGFCLSVVDFISWVVKYLWETPCFIAGILKCFASLSLCTVYVCHYMHACGGQRTVLDVLPQVLFFFQAEHDLVGYKRALWKSSERSAGLSTCSGTMIGDMFDSTTIRNEYLSNHVFKFICKSLNLGKPHFFEMGIVWWPENLRLDHILLILQLGAGDASLARVNPGLCPEAPWRCHTYCLEPISPSIGHHPVGSDDMARISLTQI